MPEHDLDLEIIWQMVRHDLPRLEIQLEDLVGATGGGM